MKFVPQQICILLLLAAALAACGGSGSPDTANEDQIDPPEPPIIPPPSSPMRKPLPSAIFHSARAITDDPNSSTVVENDINLLDFVAGTLVKVGWSLLHTSEGVFDFSKLDDEFEKAEELNTKISLVVFDGKDVPDFVAAECETFSYLFRADTTERACLPWDEQYQSYKKELVDALGERYDDSEELANIYITYAAMTNGAEMHWRVDEVAYAAVGYTEEILIQSYKDVADIYMEAFPTTSLAMEVHEVFGSSALAEQAYEHCYEEIGEYCGVAMWWCSERLTENGEEAVWPVVQLAASRSFAVCQTVGNFTNQPDRFATDEVLEPMETMQNELSFFLDQAVTVWELWTADIQNPEFEEDFIALKSSLEEIAP